MTCRSGWNGLISIFRFFFDPDADGAALPLIIPLKLSPPSLAFRFNTLPDAVLSSSDNSAIGASFVPSSFSIATLRGEAGGTGAVEVEAEDGVAPLRDRGAREAGKVASAAETEAAGARMLTLRDLGFFVCGL